MPFGRLHEEAAGDGKLLKVSDAAWRMWGMGLVYCQKNLTDGFIPEDAILSFGVKAPNKRRVAEELCRPQLPGKAPLWAHTRGGYQVHDYLQWNDSREVIIQKRKDGKDRLERWRAKREEGNAERNAFRNVDRNADRSYTEPDTLPVVRGTGSLGKGSGENPPRGVLNGALPRDHKHHAACDDTFSRCVPRAVHDKLTNLLAPKHRGHRAAASDALRAWYPTVWQTLAADFVMGDEFKFWQARFDAAFATKDAKPAEPRSNVPSADATAKYLERQRS